MFHGSSSSTTTARRRRLLRGLAAGLAATIERGQFVAQALRELAGEGDGIRGFKVASRP